MIRIERQSRVPLHLQVKNQLQELILAGTLLEGKSLPPTRKLAQAIGLNRSTVVEAYGELMAEGLVEAHVGRGTIVAGNRVVEKRAFPTQALNWQELFAASTGAVYDSVIRDTLDRFSQDTVISLAAGVPAVEYYPTREIRGIVAGLIEKEGREVFQCLPTEGY